MLANREPSIDDLNVYVVGIFMYNYVTQKLLHIFENYFQWTKDVHDLNTCQANYSADFRYEDLVLIYIDPKYEIHL